MSLCDRCYQTHCLKLKFKHLILPFNNHVTLLGMDGSSSKLSPRCHKGGMDDNPLCHVTINFIFSEISFKLNSHMRVFICNEADILSPVSVTSSVRPSGCYQLLTTFPKSDLHEIAHVYASLKK